MPILIFTSAKQVNYDRDGMDMIYSYKVSGLEELCSIHTVGVTNCWNMTPHERYEYAQYLFAGTIDYLKWYWNLHKKLPGATEEIWEDSNFGSKPKERIPWNGYRLDLL